MCISFPPFGRVARILCSYVIHSTRATHYLLLLDCWNTLSNVLMLYEHRLVCSSSIGNAKNSNYDISRATLVANCCANGCKTYAVFETTQKWEQVQKNGEKKTETVERKNNENIPFTQSTHWCRQIYTHNICLWRAHLFIIVEALTHTHTHGETCIFAVETMSSLSPQMLFFQVFNSIVKINKIKLVAVTRSSKHSIFTTSIFVEYLSERDSLLQLNVASAAVSFCGSLLAIFVRLSLARSRRFYSPLEKEKLDLLFY